MPVEMFEALLRRRDALDKIADYRLSLVCLTIVKATGAKKVDGSDWELSDFMLSDKQVEKELSQDEAVELMRATWR